MPPKKVVLLACGSFNPPTFMHLRMFEIARDHVNRQGYCTVIGGIMSPVHDGYGKKELASATHRCIMTRLALQSSNWVRLSDWESKQEAWAPTRQVLEHHQNTLNSLVNANCESPHKRQRRDDLQWLPEEVCYGLDGPVQVKLLCGADLLESFGTPGLWKAEDLDSIVGQHGLVVITRDGSNPYKFIYESDLLTKYQNNIQIITEWISNEVSSTKIRRSIRRGESVKYLIPDKVISFIEKHSIYCTEDNKYDQTNSISIFPTPSPSDINPNPIDFHNEINHPPLFLVPPSKRPTLLIEDAEVGQKKDKGVVFPGQAVQVLEVRPQAEGATDLQCDEDYVSKDSAVIQVCLCGTSELCMCDGETKWGVGENIGKSRKLQSLEKDEEVYIKDDEEYLVEDKIEKDIEEKETTVEIQFTEDGKIQVISDKETTV